MSTLFREYLQAIGSGRHTGRDLTRQEAAEATRMILVGEATPAQVGGFLIAHRIKRPTAAEMAGMLDTYEQLGPTLPDLQLSRPVAIFGHPYDGRTRTAPMAILVTLILAAAGTPVIYHGAGRCPTKYGLPLDEIWQQLEVDWRELSLVQIQRMIQEVGIGYLYVPRLFPLTQTVMQYRDQIGKRPPFATLELIWCPYQGAAHVFAGFVHPPTELTMIETFTLRGVCQYTTVKGLEGSCDLPMGRTGILSEGGERRFLKAREFGRMTDEPALDDLETLISGIQKTLAGEETGLRGAAIWNGGYYLHRLGHVEDLQAGIDLAQHLLQSGQADKKLRQLQGMMSSTLVKA